VRVQTEEIGQNAIASVPRLDGFQCSEQATLLFAGRFIWSRIAEI
jgi:hypothetical protein